MPEAQPSIAWLVSHNEGFGVQRAVVALARAAARAGCRVKVLALAEGSMSAACRAAGLEVEVLGAAGAGDFRGSLARKPLQLLHVWRSSRRLAGDIAARLQGGNVDVLHWLLPNLVPLGGRAAALAGALGVWEMPNLVSDRYPFALNRRLYQHYCRRYRITVIANSRYTANTLFGGGVEPAVIYPATDSALFDPARSDLVRKQAVGIPESATVFAIFARLFPDKGGGVLIEAVAGMPADRRPHILLVGGPNPAPFVDELHALAARRGMSEGVTILPPAGDIHRYYGAVDVACNCRTIPEPFGLSVVEAMFMQRPVLVHALGGPAESVVDGLTGWHYHAPDPAALRGGIERALADRPRWPEMGQLGRARALELFDADRLCERYLRLIRARLKDRTGPSPI